ncbi:kinase-like domain-containing protein [Tanacetum coccineum]
MLGEAAENEGNDVPNGSHFSALIEKIERLYMIHVSHQPSGLSLVGHLRSLKELWGGCYHEVLDSNKLEGHIPSSLGKCKELNALNLDDNKLSGTITGSLGECIRLTELYLSGNIFQGIIPSTLSSLRALKVLDVSQNNLSGKIPHFIDKWKLLEFLNLSFNDFEGEVFANASAFSVLGNNRLCGGLVTLGLPKYKETGRFSSVYKGILDYDDGRFVAVKIITSCSSVDFQGNDFKALVYEYIPMEVVNILNDVATALDYLHNRCQTTIVHGDLKPSNILLDDDMVAHVGDFGLGRLLGTDLNQNSSTGVKGTIGYAPPEYGIGSEITSSGDVYSFGIFLLELMTGKMPTDGMFNEGLSIHKFADMALPEHVTDVIDDDAIVLQSTEANAKKVEECLIATIKIGVSCSLDSPSQ